MQAIDGCTSTDQHDGFLAATARGDGLRKVRRLASLKSILLLPQHSQTSNVFVSVNTRAAQVTVNVNDVFQFPDNS